MTSPVSVMPAVRRQSIAAVADAGGVTVVEDLALADLTLGPGPPPPPIAALSDRVIAVGSASKLLWGGLRIGWIRAGEPLRTAILARKAGLNLATSAVSQALAARLLAAVDPGWLAAHRAALAGRRDHLAGLLRVHLPAWRSQPPEAGLSLWVELPVGSADGVRACRSAPRRHHRPWRHCVPRRGPRPLHPDVLRRATRQANAGCRAAGRGVGGARARPSGQPVTG